jgi:hypothetical protein
VVVFTGSFKPKRISFGFMICFHWNQTYDKRAYGRGFLIADTNDLERIARGISKFVWSGIIWEGGVRQEAKFIRAEYAVLDFDDGELTLEGAKRRFSDVAHIIGTTKSHTELQHRFRVVIPFEKPITVLRDYRYNMSKLCDLYESDAQCKDGARFFYPCKEIISVYKDGDAMDVRRTPKEFEDIQCNKLAQLEWSRYKRLPMWTDKFLKRGETFKDHGRQTSAFMVACAMKLAGVPKSEAYSLILNAPITRENLAEKELIQAVDSAYKR